MGQPVALLGGAGWQHALCCVGVCAVVQGSSWWSARCEVAVLLLCVRNIAAWRFASAGALRA